MLSLTPAKLVITHNGPVTQYSYTDLHQHCFGQWFVASRHQPIT